jgi:hypothetical protein
MPLTEEVPIKCMYGYIHDVMSSDNEKTRNEYYIVRVIVEGIEVIDTNIAAIPLEQTAEELTALYGPPESLIGRRVRIDYTGDNFADGVARVVAPIIPNEGQAMNDSKTRGFQYALAGGSIFNV